MTSKGCLVIREFHSIGRRNPIQRLRRSYCLRLSALIPLCRALETSVADVQNELPVLIEAMWVELAL